MRNYAILAPTFWSGRTGRAIRSRGADAQVIALYLVSSPSSTMLGLYYMPLPTLCHETGCPSDAALKALQELAELGFCQYDTESEYVWVPEMAKWQIGASLSPRDRRVRAIQRAAAKLVGSPFYDDFMRRYAEAYNLDMPAQLDMSTQSDQTRDAPSKGQAEEHAVYIQEQEQDQKQDQNQSFCAERSSPTPARQANGHTAPKVRRRSSEKNRPATEGAGAVVVSIPLVDGTEAPVTEDRIAEWESAFPSVNVRQKLREIRSWCIANPSRRKTAAGVARFINNWLSREQDRGRSGHVDGPRANSAAPPTQARRATEFRDTLDGDRVIREVYETATGKVIRRVPHPFANNRSKTKQEEQT